MLATCTRTQPHNNAKRRTVLHPPLVLPPQGVVRVDVSGPPCDHHHRTPTAAFVLLLLHVADGQPLRLRPQCVPAAEAAHALMKASTHTGKMIE